MTTQSPKKLKFAGFTIVETMIVLSIGGLILLLIFIAIPSLIKTGNNEAKKTDVGIILEAVSHYELTNSGNFPPDCTSTYVNPVNTCQKHINAINNFLQYSYGELNYYGASFQPAIIQLINHTSPPAPAVPLTTSSANDTVRVINYMKCDLSRPGYTTTTGADYSDVVALFAYGHSTSSYGIPQCEQLY
jgi:type II secretory pathway pseudopilin PulG